MIILFKNPAGPLVTYDGLFRVHDLNPEVYTHWRMSRWELFVFGLRAIAAAIRSL